jgi:hypothetical protein
MSNDLGYRVGTMVIMKATCGNPKFAGLRGEIDAISNKTIPGSDRPDTEYTICFFCGYGRTRVGKIYSGVF